MNLFIEMPRQAPGGSAAGTPTRDSWLREVQAQYDAQARAAGPGGTGSLGGGARLGPAQAQGSFRQARVQDAENARAARSLWGGAGQSGGSVRERPGARGGGVAGARETAAQSEASPGKPPCSKGGTGAYSVSQESYREELAFHKRRARHRRLAAVGRVVALLVLIPLALLLVFVASYTLTCIMNGATPDEMLGLLLALPSRIGEFVRAIAAS